MKNTTMTGKEICQFRKDLGLRQTDCADIVGVNLRTWQKYELGQYKCKQIYIDVLERGLYDIHKNYTNTLEKVDKT